MFPLLGFLSGMVCDEKGAMAIDRLVGTRGMNK